MKLFLGLLLIYTAAATVGNLNALDSCSENSDIFSNKQSIAGLVDQIKSQLIQNSEAKQSLLANPAEFEQVKQKLLKCTEELMKRNQFKVLENLLDDVLDPLDIDFSNEMRLIGTQIKKDIDSLVTLAHSKKHTKIVTPAFQWIQSRSNLFLQIKFAHRHDAPGCLEVKNEKIEFTEDGFSFSALGIQGQQPIQYVLKLPLYKEIVPEQSSWNLESVGRLFVNMTKATSEVWVSLLKDNEKLPQMRFWWEMKDNYQEEMKEYDKLLDELEEQEAGAKRSRGRKTKKSDDNVAAVEPESTTEAKEQPANVEL